MAAIETTLKALARAALLQRVTEIESRAQAAGQLPLDVTDWPGMLEAISGAVADGAPADGTVRALARRLDDDGRWRRDRDRLGAALNRLAKARGGPAPIRRRPDVDRAAWRVEAPAAAQEVRRGDGGHPRRRARRAAPCPQRHPWMLSGSALPRCPPGWRRTTLSRILRTGGSAPAGWATRRNPAIPAGAATPQHSSPRDGRFPARGRPPACRPATWRAPGISSTPKRRGSMPRSSATACGPSAGGHTP